jgi:hypothetical protein
MSNINPYSFYLYFKVDNFTLKIEEPYMFDAFSHSVERKTGGFSVDVYTFAENISLHFTDNIYTKTNEYEDIDGTMQIGV